VLLSGLPVLHQDCSSCRSSRRLLREQRASSRPNPSLSDRIRPDDIHGQIAALLGLLLVLAGYCIPIDASCPWHSDSRRDWTFRATLIVALVMIPLSGSSWPVVRDPANAPAADSSG
jgi:hypothetical protein